MLGKLLKHEMRSTAGVFLILAAAALILSMIAGFAMRGARSGNLYTYYVNPYQTIGVLLFDVYVNFIAVLIIITVVMNIRRFHKNILGGEGYLMHTLPVPTWMLIASKAIAAFVWTIVVGAAAVISGMLFCLIAVGDIYDITEFVGNYFADTSVGIIVVFIIMIVVEVVQLILCVYASMAVGGSAYKHKALFSFLAFILFIIIYNVITRLFFTGNTFALTYAAGYLPSLLSVTWPRVLIPELIFSAAYFLIALYFLKKRLNLE